MATGGGDGDWLARGALTAGTGGVDGGVDGGGVAAARVGVADGRAAATGGVGTAAGTAAAAWGTLARAASGTGMLNQMPAATPVKNNPAAPAAQARKVKKRPSAEPFLPRRSRR